MFIRDAGIDAEHLLIDPVVTIPLPLSLVPDDETEPLRWPGTVPTMLWHPLAWLPERLSQPLTVTIDDGEEVTETDQEWAVRVALELQTSSSAACSPRSSSRLVPTTSQTSR
ncbi:hypothetical protein I8920_00435 [Curtobacterium sp. YC1]|uniref:hypothetical protein n=1 Tax=Curtobacterium sp. YC1 TaxID=2795488 RepID=UPI0018E559E8|nr:hypothetical protein [Curtobacterium sp. YC1]QQD76286.1 hypothetical protein I8920_00435 [Curtobacterium sp. YC1]